MSRENNNTNALNIIIQETTEIFNKIPREELNSKTSYELMKECIFASTRLADLFLSFDNGERNITPTSISELNEFVCRFLLGLRIAYYNLSYADDWVDVSIQKALLTTRKIFDGCLTIPE